MKTSLLIKDRGFKLSVLPDSRVDNVEKYGLVADSCVYLTDGFVGHVVSQLPAFNLPRSATRGCSFEDILELSYPFGSHYIAVVNKKSSKVFVGQFLKEVDPMFDSKLGHNFVAISEPLVMSLDGSEGINLSLFDRTFELNMLELIFQKKRETLD